MKKIILFLTSALVLAMTMLPVFAATTVNTYEQSILDKLAAGVVVGTKTVALSTEELNIAKNFFMMDGVDFTQADATAILDAIDDIAVVIKAAGVTDLTKLTLDDKNEILALAQAATASVASISLTFEYDVATKTVSILSGQSVMVQSDVSTASTVVKNTGMNATVSFWMFSILGLTMVAAVAFAKKNNLLVAKA
ncbi:MAG: hypothetical protein A2Y20_03640 [Firmicutes bacterium GWF2_51_9]|nr:hypothetical protein [Erysipelotrichaceae bacterium]OGS53830.1 MAG: hypothetical protein A2Y20_03640 [Firmicutes bacterium GWF2_51_9]OGS57884.1 MAG: hypothetical protein A2Y19_10440 [Firmicutes bacterium GWE2_51_13]HAM63920.1 hypothetical protein [Erysipelotrichaceae bacterium]HAO60484.1 hypothetical protein [Erysipelotrichaceae bacterium]